jgi:DNA-binding HxlR family transcriptional regulator
MTSEVSEETTRANETTHLYCPLDAALDMLTQRWTLHVLRTLLDGPRRFNEVAQAINLNAHTLRDRLKALEDNDVVTRRVVSKNPPNVEYALTEKGYALNKIFEEIAAWGRTWMEPPRK